MQVGHTWYPPQHPQKPKGAFSDGRQDPELGIRKHKDICFSVYLFFILHGHSPADLKLMAYNPLRALTSPLSSTSSHHKNIKQTKKLNKTKNNNKTQKTKNPELLAHFTESAPNQLHTLRLGGHCGFPLCGWLYLLPHFVPLIIYEKGNIRHILKHAN